MADETKNAAWWENQAMQFKRELDDLNPKLNVAEARIRELDASLALEKRERAHEHSTHLACENELKSAISDAETARDNAYAEGQRLKNQLEAALADGVQARSGWQAAQAEVERLKAANEKKTAGLNACLAGVAAQLKTIQDAIEA